MMAHARDDYSLLLSLPFRNDDITELVRHADGAFAQDIIDKCTEKELARHPELVSSLALILLIQGHRFLFVRYWSALQRMCARPEDYEPARYRRLLGEVEFIKSFLVFNDLPAMCAAHERAFEYLCGRPTMLFSHKGLWTYGASSVVCMFWREAGKLRETIDVLRRGMVCYCKLTNNHGIGAPDAMEADALLLAGDDSGAERLCRAALELADSHGQDSIAFCAELTLARIAILRGDVKAFAKQLENIRKRSVGSYEPSGAATADMCRAFLASLLDMDDGIPAWMCGMKSIRENIYLSAAPFAYISYARTLLRREPKEFQKLCCEMRGETELQHMLLPELYFLIFTAIDLERSKDRAGALDALGQALNMAIWDRVFLPFAEHGEELAPLIALARKDRPADSEALCELSALCERMRAGMRMVKDNVRTISTALTRRERQVALLIKQGLSTKRIGELLGITDGTVRVIKKNIYRKMEIHTKVELIKKQL